VDRGNIRSQFRTWRLQKTKRKWLIFGVVQPCSAFFGQTDIYSVNAHNQQTVVPVVGLEPGCGYVCGFAKTTQRAHLHWVKSTLALFGPAKAHALLTHVAC
jgi:hypothetical protein